MYFMDDEHPSLWVPVGISILLHLILVIIAIAVPTYMPVEPKPMIIEAFPETPKELEKQLAQPKDSMRIADIAKPAVQERPKAAKFVGMYDSTVPDETVGTGVVTSKAEAKKIKQAKAEASATKASADKKVKGKIKTKPKDKLYNFDEDMFAMREPLPSSTSISASTFPTETSVGTVSIGDAGAVGDYFPDIKRGNYTYLNVLRYPAVSYFVRMKRAFRTTFDPVPALRTYFSVNRVARGSVNVVLAVSVNEQGNLAELFVLRSSGIPSYDQESLRTVRASSPFARPPEKFLADDGALRMMWTFSVYL